MNPYSNKSRCPACSNEYASSFFVGLTEGGEDKGYINRTCSRCKYVWRELPLYRTQEVDQVEKLYIHIIGLTELDKKIKEIVRESLSRVFNLEAFDMSKKGNNG